MSKWRHSSTHGTRRSELIESSFLIHPELDVICDGYSLRLVDPYNAPVLYLRRPGDDHEEVIRYQNDDPFFSEVANLIDNIEKGPGSAPILSSYEDAAMTYGKDCPQDSASHVALLIAHKHMPTTTQRLLGQSVMPPSESELVSE